MNEINKERFTGFSELYDDSRPNPPQKVVQIIRTYIDAVSCIADLGSGTGLSAKIWESEADTIIGIEPTDDMRNVAAAKYKNILFINADSYNTKIKSQTADVVTCSQSFHWMEPKSTLQEVNRILRSGGVFAVYDCEFPVQWNLEAEIAYKKLFNKARMIAQSIDQKINKQYPKEEHFKNIQESGYFKYCKEIYFDNVEKCDSKRFISIGLSQGLIQDLLKNNNEEIKKEIEIFVHTCGNITNDEMRVSYKMSIGVK